MPKRYEVRHRGVAIVCGGAPCLFEDLESAKKLRPEAEILGVNATAALVKEIEHIWTQHNNLAGQFKAKAGRDVKVHARSNVMGNDVDYVWPELNWVSGSSGVAAALWARHGMGFDEVIMAGVPLHVNKLSYVAGYPSKPTKENGSFAEKHQVEHWLMMLKSHIAEGKTQGIYSMSGATSRLLGFPC